MPEQPPKKLTRITLTDRRPVSVDPEEWPVIAAADGDSYASRDYSRHQQALGQGELDRYRLRVRQHADGRTIIYGVFDAATAWTGSEDRAGGRLLEPTRAGGDSAAIVQAILAVGADCRLPESVIRECVGDLPEEEL